MKVKSVNHIKDRGMMVAVDVPLRGIGPGWHLGCGESVWAVSAVDTAKSTGQRHRAVVGLLLIPVKGRAEPKAGDVLEVRPSPRA